MILDIAAFCAPEIKLRKPNLNLGEKQKILLPKGSFSPGSRNKLTELFRNAGFDKVANGEFNGQDRVVQGDFEFIGLKGNDSLSVDIEDLGEYSRETVGMIIGTDVLIESYLRSLTNDTAMFVERLVRLGIGQCSLNFQAPKEQPINMKEDINGAVVMTKYPYFACNIVRSMGLMARICYDERMLREAQQEELRSNIKIVKIRPTEGADTKTNKQRCRSDRRVIDFEITESGNTAMKDNALMITNFRNPKTGELENPVSDIPEITISTDFTAINLESISLFSRGALQALGTALESALDPRRFAEIVWDAPASAIGNFKELGVDGPNIVPVLSKSGVELVSMKVLVPNDQADATSLLIQALEGASRGVTRDIRLIPDNPQVMDVLPLLPEQTNDLKRRLGIS